MSAFQKLLSLSGSIRGKKNIAYNSVISPGTSEQWEQHLQRPKGCLFSMFMEPTEASRAGSSKQGSTERKKHGQQDGSVGKPLDMITW